LNKLSSRYKLVIGNFTKVNTYPFNPSDHLAHTFHLKDIEDLILRRLLDEYYIHELPLPLDIGLCAKKIRMEKKKILIEKILNQFFVKTESGFVQKRCEKVIKKYKKLSEAGNVGNKKRYE